jgi:hypothetical protein
MTLKEFRRDRLEWLALVDRCRDNPTRRNAQAEIAKRRELEGKLALVEAADAYVGRCLRRHVMDSMTWQQIARDLGGTTGDSVRVMVQRYLRRMAAGDGRVKLSESAAPNRSPSIHAEKNPGSAQNEPPAEEEPR